MNYMKNSRLSPSMCRLCGLITRFVSGINYPWFCFPNSAQGGSFLLMTDPLQTIRTNVPGQPNQVHSQAFTKRCLATTISTFSGVCLYRYGWGRRRLSTGRSWVRDAKMFERERENSKDYTSICGGPKNLTCNPDRRKVGWFTVSAFIWCIAGQVNDHTISTEPEIKCFKYVLSLKKCT